MTRPRRSFTDEFEREAVKLCKQPGSTVTHIARDLCIKTIVLRRWLPGAWQGAGSQPEPAPSQ